MQGATALRRLVLAVLLAAGVVGKLTMAAAQEAPAPGMLEARLQTVFAWQWEAAG
jgi:hypothetical protein